MDSLPSYYAKMMQIFSIENQNFTKLKVFSPVNLDEQ